MKERLPECVFPVGEYNAMRLSLGIIGRKCNSGARSPRTSDATHLPFWPYSRGCCWKLFRKCLGISPSHTSCASIHLSGAGGQSFLEVAHLYDQRADQLSQLLIRACFNNCQFHTKILLRFWICDKVTHILYPFQTDNIRVFRWRALAYPTLKEKVLHLHPCGNGTSIPLLVFHKFIGLISGAWY